MKTRQFLMGALFISILASVPSITMAGQSPRRGGSSGFGQAAEANGMDIRIGRPGAPVSGKASMKVRKVVGPDIIETPEGTPQKYSKKSGGYYFYGSYTPYQDTDQAATIYWEGDDAYIYNILSYKETESYVKGTREGNSLKVKLDQTVAKGEEFDIKLGLLRTELIQAPNPEWEEGDDEDTKNIIYINFVYNTDHSEVTYAIGADGSLTLEIPQVLDAGIDAPDDGYTYLNPGDYGFPDYCLGFYYTDDFSWTGDGDIYQEYVEFNYEKVEIPEGLTFDFYSYLNHYDEGVLVYVARDGDDLYFKGLSAFLPEAVFKATIKTTDKGMVASVPQNQFIGTSQDGYYNLLTRTVVNNRGNYTVAPADVDAEFDIVTDENGVIVSFRGSNTDHILIFNYANDIYDPYDEFPGVTLKYQESLAGEPQAPAGAYFQEHATWLGANFLFFYLDPFTAEGTILDVEKLYYRVYINGKPFEFQQHDGENLNGHFVTMYEGVNPASSLIPYTFYNGFDLWFDEYHLYYVGFYTTDIDSIGVQTVYIYEGQEICSEIVDVDVSGVREISDSETVSCEYYTLDGRKMKRPDKGVYIKIEKLSNGTTKVKKEAL